jgi:hypothetical protein
MTPFSACHRRLPSLVSLREQNKERDRVGERAESREREQREQRERDLETTWHNKTLQNSAREKARIHHARISKLTDNIIEDGSERGELVFLLLRVVHLHATRLPRWPPCN